MSWQQYVDSNLVGTQRVAQAAIWGLAGGQWATSAGFQLSDPEYTALSAGFKDPSKLQANGVTVAGVKYMFLRAEGDDTLLAKKGDTGLVVTKTTQAIIIAVAKAPQRIEDANVVVGALADYLRGVGY